MHPNDLRMRKVGMSSTTRLAPGGTGLRHFDPQERMKAWFVKRIVGPVFALLRQGVAPERIALGLACGAIIGVFPVLGTTTVLCTLVALALRLNLVAVHAVHFAMTPVQLLLIIPFVRVGEAVAEAPRQPLSITAGLELISHGAWHATVVLWGAIVHAVIGWLLLGPLALFLLYVVLRRVIVRAARRTVVQPMPTSEQQ